jgi:hypothetical protein
MKISQKLERHICNLENDLLKPEVRLSAERISGLLAEGFFEFGSSGRIYNYTAGDVFDDNGETYAMEDFKAYCLSRCCVLATYKAIRKGPEGNVTSVTLRSSIWKRIGGAWKMVFHQGTPIK